MTIFVHLGADLSNLKGAKNASGVISKKICLDFLGGFHPCI
jgi:hypothetical protein